MLSAFTASRGRAQGVTTRVSDSAGVTVVTNRLTTGGQSIQTTRWAIESEFGATGGSRTVSFGTVALVRVSHNGTLLAFDQSAGALRVMAPTDSTFRSIGRRGPGPGEFLAVTNEFLFGGADTVLVPQLGARRVDRFLPNGKYAGAYELPRNVPVTFAKDWVFRRDGALAFWYLSSSRDQLLMTYTPTSGRLDTLLVLFPWRGNAELIPRGYMPRPTGAWCMTSTGRIVAGQTDKNRLRVHSEDGKLERVIEVAIPARSVGAQERAELVKREQDRQRLAAGRVVGEPNIAPTWPFFARVMCGPEEQIWVEHFPMLKDVTTELLAAGLDYDEARSGLWDIYDRDGRFVGRAELPARVRADQIGDGTIVGAGETPLGEHTIVRLRVSPR